MDKLFLRLEIKKGNAVVLRYVALSCVCELNPDSKILTCVYGSEIKSYLLTDNSYYGVENVLKTMTL